jgi:hypothetical protein
VVGLALAIVLLGTLTAACGGSGGARPSRSSAGAGTSTAVPQPIAKHPPLPAGASPSSSARLLCSSGLQHVLRSALGETPLRAPQAAWANHLYTCTYTYAGARLVLSVQEESSWPETLGYFRSLGSRLGHARTLGGLGEGAFVTDNGSVVVRKDWRILLVDISGLPRRWAHPPASRRTLALTVTDAILACWRGY